MCFKIKQRRHFNDIYAFIASQIDRKGAKYIVEALRKNCSLVELDLSCFELKQELFILSVKYFLCVFANRQFQYLF